MASLNRTVEYVGGSGIAYTFELFSTDHVFESKQGGVYLFSKRTIKEGKGSHELLYFGKAKVFNNRLDNHEKWNDAIALGCNCIGVYETVNEARSLEVEKDLLLANTTKLNIQNN